MPAINFTLFLDQIADGRKQLTLRKPRTDGRPRATVGEAQPLRLYTGLRTSAPRLILETRTVYRCGIQLGPWGIVAAWDIDQSAAGPFDVMKLIEEWLDQLSRNRRSFFLGGVFARLDGFETYAALYDWHREQGLDDIGCVSRELIAWAPPGWPL